MKKSTLLFLLLIIFLCAASIVDAQIKSGEFSGLFHSAADDSLDIDHLRIKEVIRSSGDANAGNNTKYFFRVRYWWE